MQFDSVPGIWQEFLWDKLSHSTCAEATEVIRAFLKWKLRDLWAYEKWSVKSIFDQNLTCWQFEILLLSNNNPNLYKTLAKFQIPNSSQSWEIQDFDQMGWFPYFMNVRYLTVFQTFDKYLLETNCLTIHVQKVNR